MPENDQLEQFKQTVRELETNNDPADFDGKMMGMKLQTKKPAKPNKKS